MGISIGAAVTWMSVSSKLTVNASEDDDQNVKSKLSVTLPRGFCLLFENPRNHRRKSRAGSPATVIYFAEFLFFAEIPSCNGRADGSWQS